MKQIVFFLFVIVLVSCGKDDPKVSAKAILTGAPNGWLITSEIVAGQDVFGSQDACDKDNVTIFQSDGTLKILTNTKCDQSEADTETGTWTLSSDEKTLTVSSSTDFDFTATIVEIDSNHVKANISTTIQGITITATITLAPK